MPAAYDYYDYPSYWKGRDYEHEAEVFAVKSFLKKIPHIKTLLDIGSGYGRLTASYLSTASNVILSDPSVKLLNIAKKTYKDKKVSFIQSKLENLPKRLKNDSIDLIIIIRVLHHLKNLDNSLPIVSGLLKKEGFLILEFANKKHLKALICEFLKGNLTFPLEIFPQEKCKKSKKKRLPFFNYHPDQILSKLSGNGFKILEVRSVSNIRNQLLKKFLPKKVLIFIEKSTQRLLSKINFGPSIFVLAQKNNS